MHFVSFVPNCLSRRYAFFFVHTLWRPHKCLKVNDYRNKFVNELHNNGLYVCETIRVELYYKEQEFNS